MKKYDDLTKEQQEVAIEFARITIEECFADGLFTTNRPVTPEELDDLAHIAAEESEYDDDGKVIVGNNVHPYYLGGCV